MTQEATSEGPSRAVVTEATTARALTALVEAGFDAVVSSRPEDVEYLTSERAFCYRVLAEGRMTELVLLAAEADGPIVFTQHAYVDYYTSVGVAAQRLEELPRAVGRLGGQARVAVSSECPAALHALVRSAGVTLVEADPLAASRLVKDDVEVAAIRAACRIAETGMQTLIEATRVGASECEVAAAGEAAMRRAGAGGLCFSTVVSSGPELGLMREFATNRLIKAGDWVMIDGGCTVDGYNAEFARSLRVGGDDELFAAAHATVHDAQRAAITAAHAGVPAREVDRVARQVIADSSFAEHCYKHITGHGIGTGVWELPMVGPDSEESLLPGSVISVEPGVFIRGIGGIRIEDLVLITAGDPEILTRAPIHPTTIESLRK
jgi:Xaa-Pro aminopeptidase